MLTRFCPMEQGAQLSSMSADTRHTLVAFGVAIGVVVAFIPLAIRIDDGMDRSRNVYQDLVEMAELQYQATLESGDAHPVEVRPGESVAVGGSRFATHSDVTLRVEVHDSGYCVA